MCEYWDQFYILVEFNYRLGELHNKVATQTAMHNVKRDQENPRVCYSPNAFRQQGNNLPWENRHKI